MSVVSARFDDETAGVALTKREQVRCQVSFFFQWQRRKGWTDDEMPHRCSFWSEADARPGVWPCWFDNRRVLVGAAMLDRFLLNKTFGKLVVVWTALDRVQGRRLTCPPGCHPSLPILRSILLLRRTGH